MSEFFIILFKTNYTGCSLIFCIFAIEVISNIRIYVTEKRLLSSYVICFWKHKFASKHLNFFCVCRWTCLLSSYKKMWSNFPSKVLFLRLLINTCFYNFVIYFHLFTCVFLEEHESAYHIFFNTWLLHINLQKLCSMWGYQPNNVLNWHFQ